MRDGRAHDHIVEMLRNAKGEVDPASVAEIIEQVLTQATSETEEGAERRIVDLQASMQERLTRLLDASPAVIYSFKARDDFLPIFVSDNIGTLFGYAPRDYLDAPNFWCERVHPEDLPRIEAEIGNLFVKGKDTLEYRFRRKGGTYCWVSDEQHLMCDEKGEPLEIVGSWSDISARKKAEEAEDALQARASAISTAAIVGSARAASDP